MCKPRVARRGKLKKKKDTGKLKFGERLVAK